MIEEFAPEFKRPEFVFIPKTKPATALLFHAMAEDHLVTYPPNHFECAIIDPPYGLSKDNINVAELFAAWGRGEDINFSGRVGYLNEKWDGFVPQPGYWRELWRVMKPGAFVAAFAAPRTADYAATAARVGGFVKRDELIWRHRNLFAIWENQGPNVEGTDYIDAIRYARRHHTVKGVTRVVRTEEGQRFDGYHRALMQRHTPILLLQKPLETGLSIAENLMVHGVGAMNIKKCKSANGSHPTSLIETSYTTHAEYNEGIYISGSSDAKDTRAARADYGHDCPKPVELLRWLARLLCPANGTVLDTFMGSASMGIAALEEGFSYVGIEQDTTHFASANRRVNEYLERKETTP